MSALIDTRNQINTLETGLKSLKKCAVLMRQLEFQSMYSAVECHHREMKLAHLTGKPKDLMEQGKHDTKFFYILMQMLREIQSCRIRDQRRNLNLVYEWYVKNRHVLHNRPRFGKQKGRNGEGSLTPSILKTSHNQMESQARYLQAAMMNNNNSDSNAAEHITPSVKTDASPSQRRNEVTSLKSQAANGSPRSAKTEKLLPQRKPLPLSHMYNPHARPPDTMVSNEEIATPVTLKITSGDVSTSGQNSEYKTEQMRKWDNFQQEMTYGQEMLGKLQHVGRSGVAGGTRYTAHESGLVAEELTDQVVTGLSTADHNPHRPSSSGDNKLMGKELEEFYQFTEGYYPHDLQKYPSIQHHATRTKSAPVRNSHKKARPISGRRVVSAKLPSRLDQNKPADDTGIKLDTMVGMIDSITDEMNYHKEKLAPEPQSGFRQPAVEMNPDELSLAMTSSAFLPPGGRPSTPEQDQCWWRDGMYHADLNVNWSGTTIGSRNAMVVPGAQPYMLNDPSGVHYSHYFRPQYRKFIPTPPAVPDIIDWRGTVSPSVSSKARWKNNGLSGHTFVKKVSGGKSKLRTAGKTHAGSRPRTAPVTVKERWPTKNAMKENVRPASQAASHNATELDPDSSNAIMSVHHIGGHSRKLRNRQFYDYDYFDKMSSKEYGDVQSQHEQTAAGMEYLTFVAPFSFPGSRENSAAMSRVSFSNKTSDIGHPTPSPELGFQAHTPADIDSLGSGNFDVQDINDLDDELADWENASQDMGDDFDDPTDICENSRQLCSEIEGMLDKGGEKYDADTSKITDSEVITVKHDTECTEADVKPETGLKNCDTDKTATEIEKDDQFQDSERQKSASWNMDGISGLQFHGQSDDVLASEQPVAVVKPRTAPGRTPPLTLPHDIHFETGDLTYSSQPMNSPRAQKQRLYARAFPPSENPETPDFSVQGKGQVRSKPTHSEKPRARSAGSVPSRAKSANHLATLIKQREMLRKSQSKVIHSSPSIPASRSHSRLSDKDHEPSPRTGKAYCAEQEQHARHDTSPRHYMQKVGILRDGRDNEWQHGSLEAEGVPLQDCMSLRIMKLNPNKQKDQMAAQNMEIYPGTPTNSEDAAEQSALEILAKLQESASSAPLVVKRDESQTPKNLHDIGRPIPDYTEVNDPIEYAAAVERLKEAKAAVSIQRLFRGYVARNQYMYLKKEAREKREDRKKAAIRIQRLYRGHLVRQFHIYNRPASRESLAWAHYYKQQLVVRQEEREAKAEITAKINSTRHSAAESKLKRIGPHVEVYDGFHPKITGPDKKLLDQAATIIQKWVRRWSTVRMLQCLKRKSKQHASSWGKFVSHYRDLLIRIQRRQGEQRPKTYFDYKNVSDFMDTKKRYENVFDRKAFGGELEREDLRPYFNECDLYPAQNEIQESYDVVFRGRDERKSGRLLKQDVLEILFQLYPPEGSRITSKRRSTWLTPIIDGEEALKIMGSEQVEPTDFGTCWKLVSDSHRERVQQAQAEEDSLRDAQEREIEAELQKRSQKSKEQPQVKGPAEETKREEESDTIRNTLSQAGQSYSVIGGLHAITEEEEEEEED